MDAPQFHTHTFPGPSLDQTGYQPSDSRQPRDQHDDASVQTPLLSDSLLRGQKIVEIVHNGNLYKLQATKLGKLILTK
jgi:hemin uptake protein HemP